MHILSRPNIGCNTDCMLWWAHASKYLSGWGKKQRSRPWYDSQPFLDGDMNRWKIIRSEQDKYAFICMFRTDKAKECQAKQESQFMMSLCQGVSSFNVSMLTSSSERWSSLWNESELQKTIHLTSCSLVKSQLSTLEWGKSGKSDLF